LPAAASQGQVEAVVAELAADPAVHGILVQLPLPVGLASDPVIDLIPPAKDVDGLTAASLGRLARGTPGLIPCTPRGIMALLAHYEVPVRGQRAVVIGRSQLVGLPVALLLAAKGTDATVTIAHSRSADLAGVCREADILVSAVGVGRLVTTDFVKPGAAVLDVGISRTEAGIVGDVDYAAVAEVAGWVTPMPGGTGAMTPAMLLENTVDAYCVQQGKVV
jgi:methylenetetrahydrofolate dehydrogenase (NADP+)/methenyltetrahydrofolate cyclohydrolase